MKSDNSHILFDGFLFNATSTSTGKRCVGLYCQIFLFEDSGYIEFMGIKAAESVY